MRHLRLEVRLFFRGAIIDLAWPVNVILETFYGINDCLTGCLLWHDLASPVWSVLIGVVAFAMGNFAPIAGDLETIRNIYFFGWLIRVFVPNTTTLNLVSLKSQSLVFLLFLAFGILWRIVTTL